MRLIEIKKINGTYAGLRFSKTTLKLIREFIKKHNIKNPVKEKDLHVTLLYSRKRMKGYKARKSMHTPFACKPRCLSVWETQPNDDGETQNALVLKLHCMDVVLRHKFLMKKYEGTWDHPSYIPHVTLSYNIGEDFDTGVIKDLKEEIPELKLNSEYQQDLDLNWI